ncbi:MAG: LTA synthase family protein, partial [Bacteroidota bacterium]|nr:LTA synthase family protein [Bacteroidota bacterium]
MKKLLNILLRYYAFWITFSILMRAGFLFYNHEQTAEFSSTEIIKTFLYGIKLDLCMSAYFLLIPLLLLTFSFLIKKSILKTILNIYTFLLILISSWISIIDFELYRNWGFRMDKTLLLYLKTPGEAFASTETWITVLFLASILIVTLALFFAYRKLIINSIDVCNLKSTKNSLWLLLALPLLILPIRGGFGVATLNTSAVYFHTAPFVNHAAINVVWNVGYSLSTNENAKSYQFFNNEKANLIFDGLQKENGNTSRMLNTSRPNIIIIILESFSARIIEPLGGEAGVCPNFNRFCNEGVLFDHFYANGDRSDKGLACIISSYPAQPTSSIIKFPEKTT